MDIPDIKKHKSFFRGGCYFHIAAGVAGDWVVSISKTVLDSYTGGLYRWKHEDCPQLQKLYLGARSAVLRVEKGGDKSCVKFFYDGRFYVRLRNLLGFAKAKRAFDKGLRLQRLGINAPKMFGWSVDYKSGLAVLAVEMVECAERVDIWINQYGISKELIRAFAEFISDMHEKGVSHSDLSLRNVIVGLCDGQLKFWLLDYEDTSFSKTASYSRRLNNLNHLNERTLDMPPKYRLLFLKYYLGGSGSVKKWAEDLSNYLSKHPSKYTEIFYADKSEEVKK